MQLIRSLCLVAAVLLAGCSSYSSRWEEARVAKGGDKFAGAYEGTWSSGKMKGTGGKLWCILEKSGRNEYTADFRATWHGVFASEHVARLVVTERMSLKGQQIDDKLRWVGVPVDSALGALMGSPGWSKEQGVDVVAFRGGAKIEMWIGSGTYECKGRLVGGVVRDCTGRVRGTADMMQVVVPPRLEANYDAAYDTGRFDLTKAAPR